MLKFNQRQFAVLADKLADAANLALGALVFGQALSGVFSPRLAIGGWFLWLTLLALSLWAAREEERWRARS